VTACAVLADCTAARQHQPVGVGVRVGVGVGVLGDVGVAASLAKVYGYFAAKSGSTTNTAETAAQNIIDTIHKYYADPGDRQWPKVQAYLNGGSPRFNYHRFPAEVDIAAAFESFAQLFPAAQPPSGF
jgi:hypothetical protein